MVAENFDDHFGDLSRSPLLLPARKLWMRLIAERLPLFGTYRDYAMIEGEP